MSRGKRNGSWRGFKAARKAGQPLAGTFGKASPVRSLMKDGVPLVEGLDAARYSAASDTNRRVAPEFKGKVHIRDERWNVYNFTCTKCGNAQAVPDYRIEKGKPVSCMCCGWSPTEEKMKAPANGVSRGPSKGTEVS